MTLESKEEKNGEISDLESQPPKREKRLFSFLLSNKVPPVPLAEERKKFPKHSWNVISWMFFWWLNPMLKVGYKRTLRVEDMYTLNNDQKIQTIYTRFMRILRDDASVYTAKEEENDNIKLDPETVAANHKLLLEDSDSLAGLHITTTILAKALFKTFGVTYMIGIFELLLTFIASTLMPLLQKALTDFVERKALGLPVAIGKGIGYSIGCSAMVLFVGLAINHFFYRSQTVGAQVRAVLIKVLLEKSYRIDARGHHDFPTGKITAFMSTDLNRIDLAMGFMPFMAVVLVPVIICVVLLIVNIGVSSLVGIAVFVVSSIMLGLTVKTLMRLRESANHYTDKRVNLTKELLKNFKMVKLYCWENSYRKRLTETRGKEMGYVFKLQNLRNLLTAYAMSLPTISSMVAFCVLYAIGSNRSVGSIFSSLSLFSELASQFSMLPMAVAVGSDFIIGVRRLAKFFSAGEVPLDGSKPEKLEDPKLALQIENGNFYWESFGDNDDDRNDIDDVETTNVEEEQVKNYNIIKKLLHRKRSHHSQSTSDSEIKSDDASKSPSPVDTESPSLTELNNVNISIKKGEFVVVVGHIGSGKSSLLEALAGFMTKKTGHIRANGSLVLCGYPWVQNTTVRNNITFGHEFDRHRYSEIVDSCCLEDDFKLLPGGDNTEVGERGVTLSGGQKARINLARAVYANTDTILLDDVLSAVDAKVGKRIMDRCILGVLANKTRVLATHQLSLIGSADRLIFMNGDGTMDIGTQKELMTRNKGFVHLMQFGIADDKDTNDANNKVAKADDGDNPSLRRWKTQMVKDTQEVRITKEEERAVNGIKMSVYREYLNQGRGAFKWTYLPILILSMLLSTFCAIFTNTWLSFWTSHKFVGRSDHFYIGIYVMLAILSVIFLTFEFWLLVYFFNTAARQLNIRASSRLLHAPLSFVDTTPMGRIMNRFTKDTDVCDNELIQQYRMFINPFCQIAGTMILCIIYLPWFAIAIPVLAFVYVAIASFYQASAREVKRLEAVQRSFVYSHFSESLGGMDTVKAHNAAPRFLNEMDPMINQMNESYLITIANQRWISVNLDLVATMFVLLVSLLCCFRVFNISASSTGLVLTYILSMSGLLSLMLRALTQIENEMNSVERLNHYAVDLDQEAPYERPELDPPADWPQEGDIEFKDVCLRYRPDLPYVLKHINLNVEAHKHYGFCGRTGAGKSSIMSCLFRLQEFEGQILIDGVDISKIGLRTLRSKLSIIPQDPVLFAGTIRDNLDPFQQKTDDQLWDALRRAGLVSDEELPIVEKQHAPEKLHKFHLDQFVEDDGVNFSVGERQLLALARALVTDTRILVLDEATSSVDYETDAKIQKTIASEFADCTILCIAHRLKTILTYDKIVVMGAGTVKEFDTPHKLYEEGDIFRSMCDQSQITEADFKQKKD